MTTPMRIQLRRRKGWRKTPDCILVSRPSVYGNPVPVLLGRGSKDAHAAAKLGFEQHVQRMAVEWPANYKLFLKQLRGHDLACWCKLCEQHKDGKPWDVECEDCLPCHADVWLALANKDG